jgi:nucleoid-associated protein YgaU
MPRALIIGLVMAMALSSGCISESPPQPPTPNPNPPTAARPSLEIPTVVISPVPSPSPSPVADGQNYTVAPGDTLTTLAERFYGDASQWRTIFEANRDRMTSQDDLQVGMSLRIPSRR